MWFILTTMNINIMRSDSQATLQTMSFHICVYSHWLHHSYTHNFCMRVSRAERTAWISDPEQVQTTGSFWPCSSSATYCRHTESDFSTSNMHWYTDETYLQRFNFRLKQLSIEHKRMAMLCAGWSDTGTQEVKWNGIYVSLPIATVHQDKAVRKGAVRQQNLVELVIYYLPRHLQRKVWLKTCSQTSILRCSVSFLVLESIYSNIILT